MYKTARNYFQLPKNNSIKPIENYETITTPTPTIQTFIPTPTPTIQTSFSSNPKLTDPKIWGPSFWFTLHNGSIHYPDNPTQRVKELMKYRIMSIPYEIPCEKCKLHAHSYTQSRTHELDTIVSSKENLFNYYVDFHNKVNERYGKPILSYEKAYKIWSGQEPDVFVKYNLH